MRMTQFVCQQCGYETSGWLGKCPACSSWNSLVEVPKKLKVDSGGKLRVRKREASHAGPQKLSEIKNDAQNRIPTGFLELDRVLGGGLVRGQVVLLAGDPGIGKSTLLLEIGLNLSKEFLILYISGEESPEQIKMRALRLRSGQATNNNLYIFSQTLVEEIVSTVKDLHTELIIVDSIQTMESENLTGAAGSVGQIREVASILIALAKEREIPIFLVGHVTKEGTIAGPMVLSHMVDTALFIEGERFKDLRIVRALKNRFGPVDEVGVFRIVQNGINEVKNPSEFFLGGNGILNGKKVGASIVASIEGTRPILVEVQALVLPSKLVSPRRIVSGLDRGRVELLAAVLQKTCHLPLDRFDIFVNLAGGINLREPGLDLGICLAIFSSLKGKALAKTVAIGEVGLLGELRPVPDVAKREKEAKKLGFTRILTAERYKSLQQVLKSLDK